MAIQASITVQYQATGALGGVDSYVTSMVTPTNTNAPPPTIVQLSSGDNAIAVPSGFTANVAFIRPPSTSSNAKTVKAVSGDSNSGAWTSAPVVYPVSGLSSFYVHSAGSETLEINWG